MSEKTLPDAVADGERQTRARREIDDRFNSRLRQAFGTTPFILTKLDRFMDWVRGNSMFMLQFGIACCSIEMMHTYATNTTSTDSARVCPVAPRDRPTSSSYRGQSSRSSARA